MPRKSRKGQVRGLGDVTLNDYANSSTPKNRTKKPSNNVNVVLKKEVEKSWDDKDEEDFEDVTLNDYANSSTPKNRTKMLLNNLNVVFKNEVEKSWDDKDEEDFEGEFVLQENEDGTLSYVIQRIESRIRKKTLSSSSGGNPKGQEGGRDYPIDIWYILSDYIKPEDVGTFAAICKTSFEVVCTSRFWFGLYRRYYKNVSNMPENLQPERLIRKYGLRRNVIRALYYMYPPFVNRIKPYTTYEEHLESLKNYECQLFWYEKKNIFYIYFLKMKLRTFNSLSHSRSKTQVPDLLEILDDISANPDEHCRVLEIKCWNFYPIQAVMGLTLKHFSLTLCPTMRYLHHRLQLVFGPMINSTSNCSGGADNITVVLDPISKMKVWDWWHPLYPLGNNTMTEDLLRNRD